MILGIGTDIIEIARIMEAVELNSNFIEKLFSKNEIEYLKTRNLRAEYIAGRFAAKEAVSKALGTGFRGFNLKDIEIDRNSLGKPIVTLRGKARQIAEKNGDYRMHVSISHDRHSAVAYAVLEVL
ncbi:MULTISPECIES: holo-ACP synthase [Clostridium]|uniref:holo-ACP synthase n=1 Tax=Clostridium TaxID=1485 RepID=UPI00069D91CD|nr:MULTISPECIES: holo-ACP synthase [Clostridium]KOF55606.1 4'-phosphopantetheinyl transferase [Clostridium sp. DMHC 10]MCD2346317.1 holo-ACP synthase [Clostridium guangxiense]